MYNVGGVLNEEEAIEHEVTNEVGDASNEGDEDNDVIEDDEQQCLSLGPSLYEPLTRYPVELCRQYCSENNAAYAHTSSQTNRIFYAMFHDLSQLDVHFPS